MSYALRQGVSYCTVSGRTLFLDIVRDRYFCLNPRAEQAFDAVTAGTPADPQEVGKLVRIGILVPYPGPAAILPCRGPADGNGSLLDARSGHRSAAWESTRALIALGAASLRLRYLGLERSLLDITRRKARLPRGDNEMRRLDAIALGYRGTRAIVSEQDRCLVRSMAIARRMLAARIAPDLVVAVKLQPFKAHCWVQVGSLLVNERCDVARDYTPILVV